MTVDLTCTRGYSDGTWSPTELVEHAVTIGLRHLAITDHDTISGITEAELARKGSNRNNSRSREQHDLDA